MVYGAEAIMPADVLHDSEAEVEEACRDRLDLLEEA